MDSALQLSLDKIEGHDLKTIMAGLGELEPGIHEYSGDDLLQVADVLSSLFFIDHYERPDLQPAVDRAIEIMAKAGANIIPFIMDSFENSDMKANLSYAKVLAGIGVAAIPHLLEVYHHSEDPYKQSYALYALGKIKDRAILAVLPDVIQAMDSEHLEVRDSAIRALGKTMELISEKDISSDRRDTIWYKLFHSLSDPHPTIRAKAIRTLCKMNRGGLLSADQREQFKLVCERVAGVDDRNLWDRAFIVRKEAHEAMQELTG
ncbi:MAG: HEAT repeat domain-containing protein [Candidatus Neomarinimicrobiota bacterium]